MTALLIATDALAAVQGTVVSTNNPLALTMTQSHGLFAEFTERARLEVRSCPGPGQPESLQLLLTGEFGQQHAIQTTTNLTPGTWDWTPVATVATKFGVAQFEDSFVTNSGQRFYRVLTPPPSP